MVQRKAPNKLGIKPLCLKLDTKLVNHTPSSPSSPSSSSHEKLKKIMKKSRSIKRSNESRSLPQKKTPMKTTPDSTPNYMKSTSSFEARKEQSPQKTPTPKGLKGNESRTRSFKPLRTLTKTPSFKPVRLSKKVITCKDVDAQKATCSSTLKESKFPDYLQLDPGGTSAMKVCPYSYCSLNGHHHHAPVPPLKSFLSARRRAMKELKVRCLSPRQIKPEVVVKETVPEENKDFFIDIYSKDKGGNSDIDYEEGDCFDSGDDGLKLQGKTDVERLYDEESVSSGAWSSEEDGDSDSASESSSSSLSQQMNINLNYDDLEGSAVTTGEDEMNDQIQKEETPDEVSSTAVNDEVLIEDQNMNHHHQQQEEEAVPGVADKVKEEADKNRTTIIYNIIQFNISVFINGEKSVTVQVPAAPVTADKMATGETKEEEQEMTSKLETEETKDAEQGMTDKMEAQESEEEEHGKSDELSEVNQVVTDEQLLFSVKDLASTQQSDAVEEEASHSNSMDEEPTDVNQPIAKHEVTSETDINKDSCCENGVSNDPCRDLTGRKKPGEEAVDDLAEFNLRGPNFLPEVPEPDKETVDLRHQTVDERKNAEEFMVDFALQQAVTTLAPARKRKVELLVEAFEKVMPDPVQMYGTHNRHTSKAFTNSRPMQACN